MWKAFWANLGPSVANRLQVQLRLDLLDRAVTPLFDYRCTRWPMQRQIALEVDILQRKMVASALLSPRLPSEPLDEYCRRRARIAGTHCRQHGTWSCRWARRILSWNSHLERARNAQTWPAQTLHYRGLLWLQEQRSKFSLTNVFAGRTGTRGLPGCVHARWHEGVQRAKGMVN